MRKRAIAATMLLTAAMAFTSCAKLYEEETTETLKQNQLPHQHAQPQLR